MNNYLIDTHAHLYNEYYKDLTNIVEKSNENNVNYIINSAVDKNSMEEVIKLSSNFEKIYCTIGIHPENALIYKEKDLEFIKLNLNNKKVVALGEIGLDYHYRNDCKFEQKNLLEMQLKIAQEYNIPVVIHSREATLDTINILKKYKVTGVIHSFSGSLETAKEYINLGFLLGINGIITFKNCKLKDYITQINLKNIVLETDSPYLAPEPFRGTTNDPSNVFEIAKFISKLYNVSVEEISEITTNNARRIFDKMK